MDNRRLAFRRRMMRSDHKQKPTEGGYTRAGAPASCSWNECRRLLLLFLRLRILLVMFIHLMLRIMLILLILFHRHLLLLLLLLA